MLKRLIRSAGSEIDIQEIYPTKVSPMQRQATIEPIEEKDLPEEHKPSYERVISGQMQDTAWNEIDEKKLYQLGFARKTILSVAPFTHSAAAFLDVEAKDEARWLIYGRQTPFFLKPDTEEGRHYVGGFIHLLHNLTDSKIANEKNYRFFPTHDFEVEKIPVILTGSEVKQILQKADEEVCATHSFDFNLFQSNCYSVSVDVLACAIDIINQRIERNAAEHENSNKSIMAIRELLTHATQDNLALGVGVDTHPVVKKHLEAVDRIIAERQIPREFEKTSPSPKRQF